METIDLTPTWEEILPVWLQLAREAYRGGTDDPATIIENFRKEMLSMARAADRWNAHCKESSDAILS